MLASLSVKDMTEDKIILYLIQNYASPTIFKLMLRTGGVHNVMIHACNIPLILLQ